MDRIFLIDAVNFLFRSYYAIGPMVNDQGTSTSALFGFIRSLEKLIRDFSPTYLMAIFDGPDNKKSRRMVYAEYKMHRKGAPLDLFPQFEWADEWCVLRGIPTLCIEGVEADDAMASIAKFAEKRGAQVYLCTSDKDLTQLVNDKIQIVQVHKENRIIDTQGVVELFGVRPDQMVDYLAIVGDASDNIPGLEGFGPKTAVTLLGEFGSLDEILNHPEQVKGEKKQTILKTGRETALMSRALAMLDTQVAIPQDEETYRLKQKDTEGLIQFFRRMQFNTFLRDIEGEKKETREEGTCHFVDDPTTLDTCFSLLKTGREICIDINLCEQPSSPSGILGIALSVNPTEGWYLPCHGKLGHKAVIERLRAFFHTEKPTIFGHDVKALLHLFDTLALPHPLISFDTLLASYLLNPQSRQHSLDHLVLERLGKVASSSVDYVCQKVMNIGHLKELLEKQLTDEKLTHILTDIELPLLSVLEKMEQTGIYLDVVPLQQLGETVGRSLEELQHNIFNIAGESFNLNSPKQLSHILFDKLQIPLPMRRKSQFSTGAEVLEELAEEFPIATLLLTYRGLEKLRSTYIDALPHTIHPKTGRIHCTFSQSVAATGRLSSLNPNLQNIPVKSKEGLAIRACFKPAKADWSYIGGDYSQIELRLLAHFSEDPTLLKAFQNGEDVHRYTASLIYQVPQSEVTASMRMNAKTVNFGILYGQSSYGLAQQLRISQKEAATFIETYFQRYPNVRAYLETCKESARRTGKAMTLIGRQRPIPELLNPNPSIRAAAERLAINTPLQGTAADMIKLAMIAIDREIEQQGLQGNMILQIHDELLFEVPDFEILTFQHLIKEKMEQVFSLKVPVIVNIAIGKNWAEC